MSVHRKGTGRGWVYRWREIAPDGTAGKKTSAEYTTKTAAEIAFQQHRGAIQALAITQRRAQGPALSLTACADLWAQSALGRRRAITTGYAREVRLALARLPWTSCHEITLAELDRWQRTGGSVRALSYLRVVLRHARDYLRQPVRPEALTYRRPRGTPARPPELLTDDQVDRILSSAAELGPWAVLLLRHLATYGCRPIDLCRLTVGAYDPSTGLLHLAATKNTTAPAHPLLPIDQKAYAAHTTGRDPAASMHLRPNGQPWPISRSGSACTLILWYRRLVTPLDLPGGSGMYRLKDYAISRMDRLGIDDRTKALFTGHLDLRSLARYKATNHDQAHRAIATLGGHPGGHRPQSPTAGPNDLRPTDSIRYDNRHG